MLKDKISLLSNQPNYFKDFSHDVIKSIEISDDDKDLLYSTTKITLRRAKNHFTSVFVAEQLEKNWDRISFVKMKNYSMPCAINIPTKTIMINISAIGRQTVSNIDIKDVYALLVYSRICDFLTMKTEIKIDPSYYKIFVDFQCFVFIKIFAKRYGLIGSYVDYLPAYKFIISKYFYQNYFGFSKSLSNSYAMDLSRFDIKNLKIDCEQYDFLTIEGFLKALSDSNITPGMNNYKFTDVMLKNFGVMNLAMFEDFMRFCCIISSSTVNGNKLFPGYIQQYHPSLYFKLTEIMQQMI